MSLLALIPVTTKTEESETISTFVIEPLMAGFGQTLGNALRRVLLSHLTGAAVTQVRIDGVSHEFSTIPGVKEDVVQMLLQIKKVRFSVTNDEPQSVTLEAKGPAAVTAGDLKMGSAIHVSNPELVLATLTDAKTKLTLELTVERGRGYQASPQDSLPIGVIGLDAKFSPVTRVNYVVEDTRVGQVTNLDKLTLEISTDGSVTPAEALNQASAILVEAFGHVSGSPSGPVEAPKVHKIKEKRVGVIDDAMSLEELGISTRVLNSLKKASIETVGDLRNRDREELLTIKNLGEKSLDEVLLKIS